MNKESHRNTRCSERILQLKMRRKMKSEVNFYRKSNETCQKRTRYNQHNKLRGILTMEKGRENKSGRARQNVNHSYGTRLQVKRNREFAFSSEKNDGFGKKGKIWKFSNEVNGRLKRKRKHVKSLDKDVGYMLGNETEIGIKERKRKREQCKSIDKAEVQIKRKRHYKEYNQPDEAKSVRVKYNINDDNSLTASNGKSVFKANEHLPEASPADVKSPNEFVKTMDGLDNFKEEYMDRVENEIIGEEQHVFSKNAYPQIMEVLRNNFNNVCHFLRLTCDQSQENISNNNPQVHCINSCVERADERNINMNETVVIIQRLDCSDITHISLCNEPFAAIDGNLHQDHSSMYHSSNDFTIEVGHSVDSDHPNRDIPTSMGSYSESMDTNANVTDTVTREKMWDDFDKGIDCTEDNGHENDSEYIHVPGSTNSDVRIRPMERRKRVMVPLRIRLLKKLTMRKVWKDSTTCCLKYCWIDWPTVTVGQM